MKAVTLPTLHDISETIYPIIDKYQIQKVTVFGSYARGDATPDSDIDMVIDSGGLLHGFNFFIVWDEISKKLPVPVDVFEICEIRLGSALYKAIQEEGLVLYER